MDSLSPECTPLKHRYDSCFNAWFEGYLQPAIASSSSSTSSSYFTSSSSPSSTPSTYQAPPPPAPSAEPAAKPKERLFSLIPYDVEPPEIEAFIEIEDDDEETEDQVEEEQESESLEGKSLTVQERAKIKAEEYDRNCGGVWKEYQACLLKAISDNQPLSVLLEQARTENPLNQAEPLEVEGGGYGAPGAEP